ncbi:hypothetical protein, partial [Burkholderia sp. Se-20378]|uniref:hypothetical protein n=1 Tax=Burkholderia sp. Se-20378 TaxID=2703899 RepID=UPI00197F13C9
MRQPVRHGRIDGIVVPGRRVRVDVGCRRFGAVQREWRIHVSPARRRAHLDGAVIARKRRA